MEALDRRVRLASASAAALVVLAAAPRIASAQTLCATSGPQWILVDIEEPGDGDVVTGTVPVSGVASSAARFDRLELHVDGSFVDATSFDRTNREPFTFAWDTTTAAPGDTLLEVVACNTDTGVSGRADITAEIPEALAEDAASDPSAQAAPATGSPLALDTPSAAPVEATGPSRAQAASEPTGTVDAPAAVPTTDAAPELLDVDGTGPPFGALTLADHPEAPGPPLWLGGVVGVTGLVGLTYAFSDRWRRRSDEHEHADDVTTEIPTIVR